MVSVSKISISIILSAIAIMGQTVSLMQPESGISGGQISLYGSGFDELIAGNTVSFDEFVAEIVYASESEIRFVIPNCDPGLYHISIQSSAGSHTTSMQFTVIPTGIGEITFDLVQLFPDMNSRFEGMHYVDLDGDLDLDIIFNGAGDHVICWLINSDGQGNMEFGEYRSMAYSRDVYPADVDSDGDMDIVSLSEEKLTWFSNLDGAGNIGEIIIIDESIIAGESVQAADLDSDGDVDIVVADGSGNRIIWYENQDGLGSFSPLQTVSSAVENVFEVELADLDGDGFLDILSTSIADTKVAWYRNLNGSGSFGAQNIVANDVYNPKNIVGADLDGDGDKDILITGHDAQKIMWYENIDGLGSFSPSNSIDNSDGYALDIEAHDLDGDGDLDILATLAGVDAAVIYQNTDGLGTFASIQIAISGSWSPRHVSAGDLDGDGDLDIFYEKYDATGLFRNLTPNDFVITEPTGLSAVTHSLGTRVTLAWDSHPASNISHYQIFRGHQANPDLLLDSIYHPTQTFIDTSIQSGLSYFYRLRAVSSNGAVSNYSNEVDVHPESSVIISLMEPEAGVSGSVVTLYGSGFYPEWTESVLNFGEQAITPLVTSYNQLSFEVPITSPGFNEVSLDISDESAVAHGNFSLIPPSIGETNFFRHQPILGPDIGLYSLAVLDYEGDNDMDILARHANDDIVLHENSNGGAIFNAFRQLNFNVSTDISQMIPCDVDSDGNLDFITTGYYAETIRWYRNQGNDNFNLQPVIEDEAWHIQYVAIGDLDGDGDPDLVASIDQTWIGFGLGWYENLNGLGGFSEFQLISGEIDDSMPMDIADLDGDGDMDILEYRDPLSWYRNIDGIGGFSRAIECTDFDWGTVRSKYLVDVDADQDLDIVYSNDWEITWMRNDSGFVNFGPRTLINPGSPSYETAFISVGDYDADGDVDISATFQGDEVVGWFEFDLETGVYGPWQLIDEIPNFRLSGMTAKDLDSDGDLDIITRDYRFDQIIWFENETPNPVGITAPRELGSRIIGFEEVLLEWAPNPEPHLQEILVYRDIHPEPTNLIDHVIAIDSSYRDDDIQLGDTLYYRIRSVSLAGDTSRFTIPTMIISKFEITDVEPPAAIAGQEVHLTGVGFLGEQENVAVYLDSTEADVQSVSPNTISFLVPEMDGGFYDISLKYEEIQTYYEDQFSIIPTALGDPAFSAQPRITTDNGPTKCFASDLDGDGDIDLLSSAWGGGISWYENLDGLGSFGLRRTISNNVNGPRCVYAGDIDEDGDIDVLSTAFYSNQVAWYENLDGLGTFGPTRLISSDQEDAEAVSLADVDSDGDMDVIASGQRGELRWFENLDGRGNFGDPNLMATLDARDIKPADIDQDGDTDIIVADADNNRVAWFENLYPQTGFGDIRTINSEINSPKGVDVRDLDGDGDLDVMVASDGDMVLAWFENLDGSGTFGDQIILAEEVDAVRVHGADLDADGDVDLLAALNSSHKIVWYQNLDGLGTFGPENVLSYGSSYTRCVYAADLDGDGDIDPISADNWDLTLTWYQNLTPSQTAPGNFSLTSPIDSSIISEIDSVELSFVWEVAIDGNQDSVDYQLIIIDSLGFDTSFVSMTPQLRINIEALPRDRTLFWDVLASDGQSATQSNQTNSFMITELVALDREAQTPEETRLYSNYPNPFNPSTTIKYALVENSPVTLNIYDVKGRKILSVVNERQNAGEYSYVWSGNDRLGKAVSSGMYFSRLEVGPKSFVQKMILMK